MSRQIQIRRGTAAENNSFTGAIGEITMDTTNKTLRIHDGETTGGIALAKQSEVSSAMNDKLNKTLDNLPNTALQTIISKCMPDYSNGTTFTANTAIQAPYDCIVFWNASAGTGNPAYFMISPTGAFTTEYLTFPYYANADGYQT